MRLRLYLAAGQAGPFDYLPTLKSAFHLWTGHNDMLHNGLSLYSYSWLRGGIRFAEGASRVISAPDRGLIHEIVRGVIRAPEIGLGLRVKDKRLQQTPDFIAGEQPFRVASPVFIKHLPKAAKLGDPADQLLTQTLRHKLRQAGLDDTDATVRFDPAFIASAKTKLFKYRQIHCRASVCPVLVSGSAEQIGFAWEVGVGNSTGIGCGALV